MLDDIKQKYNSRAARLYRARIEKLANEAALTLGTQLALDVEEKSGVPEKEVDFFEHHTKPKNEDFTGMILSGVARSKEPLVDLDCELWFYLFASNWLPYIIGVWYF